MFRAAPARIIDRSIAVRLPARRLLAALLFVAMLAAVPFWLRQREVTRVLDSQQYLTSLQSAQERYRLANGQYANNIRQLDLDRPEPTFFAIGDLHPGRTGDLQTSWSLTLTRFGETWFFGTYTVTFNERGFDADRSSVEQAISPQQDPVATLANLLLR